MVMAGPDQRRAGRGPGRFDGHSDGGRAVAHHPRGTTSPAAEEGRPPDRRSVTRRSEQAHPTLRVSQGAEDAEVVASTGPAGLNAGGDVVAISDMVCTAGLDMEGHLVDGDHLRPCQLSEGSVDDG